MKDVLVETACRHVDGALLPEMTDKSSKGFYYSPGRISFNQYNSLCNQVQI